MSDTTHYDLVIIGSGSGNALVTPELESRRTAVIDRGSGSEHAFGGTCLNVGCIPTKMFVYAAEVAHTVRIYHNPLVMWIWGGVIIMGLAGVLSLSDRRHRVGAPLPARARLAAVPAGA